MRFSFFLAFLLSVASSAFATDPTSIVIPSLSLKNVAVEEALIQVGKLSRAADPQGQGISVVVCSMKVASGLPADTKLITLDEQNISIVGAIQKITRAASWLFSVQGDTIYAWDHTQCPPDQIGFGVFEVSPSRLPSGFYSDPQKYLRQQGVSFSGGSSATYKEASHLLIVRATEADLNLVRAIIEHFHDKNK